MKKAAKKPAAKKKTTESPRTGAEHSPIQAAAGKPAKPPLVRPAPEPPPKPRRTRPAHFDAKQLAAIRTQLEKERHDLGSQLTDIEQESFQTTQSDLTGEVGLDDDFADAGTATFDRERALSIQNNIRDLIDQITRAVQRIDDGSYGTCERCGRPIDAARLRALPHASLCMDCKRREERAR